MTSASFPFTRREKSKEAKVEGQAMVTVTDLDFKAVRAAVSQQKRMKDGG